MFARRLGDLKFILAKSKKTGYIRFFSYLPNNADCKSYRICMMWLGLDIPKETEIKNY